MHFKFDSEDIDLTYVFVFFFFPLKGKVEIYKMQRHKFDL